MAGTGADRIRGGTPDGGADPTGDPVVDPIQDLGAGRARDQDRGAAARVERVRSLRVRAAPDLGVGGEVVRALKGVKKRSRDEQAAADAWDAVAPDEFGEVCRFVEIKRKALVVRATDAGVRYRVERWLRTGGEKTVIAVARAPVSRVKVVM